MMSFHPMASIWKTAKPMMSTYCPLLAVVATVKRTVSRCVTGWPLLFVPWARIVNR